MKCLNCGNEIEENAKFCARCGSPVNNLMNTGVNQSGTGIGSNNMFGNNDFSTNNQLNTNNVMNNNVSDSSILFDNQVNSNANLHQVPNNNFNQGNMIVPNNSGTNNEITPEPQKNNNIFVILLILVLVAIIGVGGFFVYNEIYNSDTNDEISEKDKDDKNDNDKNKDDDNDKDLEDNNDEKDNEDNTDKDDEKDDDLENEPGDENIPVNNSTKVVIDGYEFTVPEGSYYKIMDGSYYFYNDELNPTFIVNLLICNYSIDFLKSNFETLKDVYAKEGYTYVTSDSVTENGVDYFMASLVKGQNVYLDMYSELNSSTCAETMITFVSANDAGTVAADAALYVQKLISSAKKVDTTM